MNKVFKVIWDWTRSQFSVVAENKSSHSHGKEKSVSSRTAPAASFIFKTSALSLAICLALSVSPTFASNPAKFTSDKPYDEYNFIELTNATYGEINEPTKNYRTFENLESQESQGLITFTGSVTSNVFFVANFNGGLPAPYSFKSQLFPDYDRGTVNLQSVRIQKDLTVNELFVDSEMIPHTKMSIDQEGDYGEVLYNCLNETLEVLGTTHVKKNFLNGGYSFFNILKVDGTIENVYEDPLATTLSTIGEGHAPFIRAKQVEAGNLLTGTKQGIEHLQLPYHPELLEQFFFEVDGNTTVHGYFDNLGKFRTGSLVLEGVSENTGDMYVSDDMTVSGSLTQSEGTMNFSKSSNVFSDLGHYNNTLNVISVEAHNVESADAVTSEVYKVLESGALNKAFADKVSVTGGKVIIENVTLSDEQIADLQRIFREKYPQATLEIKTSSKTNDKTGVFNVETVNALYDEKPDFQNVTFFENALKAENKALTVGDSEGNLKHSTGFKGIENAESITVNDGKSLELVGEKGESSNFFMAAVKTVVNAASKLVLGSKGLSETYSGKTKEVQLAETNATLLAAAGIYEVEKVTGNGKIEVEQGAKLALAGAEHTGDLALRGTLDVKADANLGNATLTSGSALTNSNNLHLASIVSSDNTTYTQTGGSLQTDSGWFNNSTLLISGGKIDMSEIAGGSLNDSGLGNNRISISGNGSNPVIKTEDPAEKKANWKDGLTLVKTEVLKSETSVTIEKGGVLQANKLQFDGVTENSVILAGGALETQLDQIFNDVNRDYLDIDAENLAGQEHRPTHVLGATSVGKIKDEVKTAIQGNSGIVVFNDEYVKMEGIVQAMQHFAAEASHPAEQDPEHPETASGSGVYLAFTGQVDARLTVDLANKFDQEQEAAGVAGVVLSHTTLYNEQSGHDKSTYRDLVIGYNEHEHPNSNVIDVESGIGFLSVEGADTVHVEEGKEFVLVGHHDDNEIRTDEQRQHVHSVPDSQLFNENTALIKNDKNDGGTVEVTGKFTFGSFAAHTNTVGWIGSIQIHERGEVETKKGEFAVWNIENAGNIHVDAGTILHSHNYSGEGNWLNEGQIYLSDDHKEHSQLESQDFEIKGKFENAVGAIFSSEQKNNTIVENELDNKGVGLYSVLTVNGGGKSTNDGIETAESLVVKASGSHTIGSEGVSAFKKASVGGEVVNNGDMTLGKKLEADLEAMMMVEAMSLEGDTGFEVLEDGKFTNTKNLDARLIATSDIKGQLSNTGHALYSDMVVGEHGSSTTNNYEKGEWLTVKGSHSNSAISIWNKLHVEDGGNEENSGQQQLESEFVVKGNGTYTNTETGELDATKVPTTEVSGKLVNKGKAWYDDMTIHSGGSSENSGYEQGDVKKVEQDGKHTNSGTSLWNELDVAGEFDNTGTTQTDKFILKEGGLAQVGKGELSAKDFAAEGGDLVVGNDLDLSAENRAKVELQPKGDIDTNIYVKKNGDLGLGEGSLDFADNLPSLGIPDVASRLVVTGPVTTGKGGGIAVGPDVWTDKDHHVDVNNGDLFFANGSYTVVDSNQAHEGTIFSTSSDNAKVTVEDGATLVLGGVPVPGDYYIVHGFTTQPNVDENSDWIGGWTPGDNLYVAPNGMAWDLTLHHDEDDIWVHVESRLGELDLAIPNIAEEDFNNWCRRPDAGADTKLICGVLTDPNLSVEDKQKVLNSVANLPTIGGAMTVAMQGVNNAGNSADGRASFTSDVFDEYGDYNIGDTRGNNLWIDVIGGWNQSKHLNASGGISAGYKSDSYGFVMGFDHIFAEQNLLAGVAFSFETGKLDSKGSVLPTSNKFNTFGFQAYGGWHPVEHFNLVGSAGLFFSKSDMEQNLGGLAGFDKAKADAKTTLATVSVKAESPITLKETIKVIPHAGIRYTMGKTGSYWTRLDGQNAFHNKAKAVNTVQFPVGVSYREDIQTQNGWNIRPKADLSLIAQAGNKQKTTVIGASAGVKDEIQGEFSGKFGTALSLGVQASKGNATLGLNYGLTVGDKSRSDHQFKVEAKWRF